MGLVLVNLANVSYHSKQTWNTEMTAEQQGDNCPWLPSHSMKAVKGDSLFYLCPSRIDCHLHWSFLIEGYWVHKLRLRGRHVLIVIFIAVIIVFIATSPNRRIRLTLLLNCKLCTIPLQEAIKAWGRSQHSRVHRLHCHIQATKHNAHCSCWRFDNGSGKKAGGPYV